MSKLSFTILIFVIFSHHNFCQNKTYTVTGRVFDFKNNEPLENCNIFVSRLQKGTSADKLGGFSIDLPIGKHELKFTYLGFTSKIEIITLSKSYLDLQVYLEPQILKTNEVEIIAKKEPASIVIQKIENKDIQKMPTIYSDVLRSVQVLSGVATNNELTSGYNVRGGSFDENLIYLNGYEIYRPFLLRVGVEENQTTINPYMVEKLTFYNGAFPAGYGDRMSSALDVDYSSEHSEKLKGIISASLLNFGINLRNRYKNFNWNLGTRYANPAIFLNNLQSRGDYKPSFSDIQFLGNLKVSQKSNIEFLGIYADNKFDISPTNWNGNFGFTQRWNFRGVAIKSSGGRIYSYINRLLGVRYRNKISDITQLKFSVSNYRVSEKENFDLSSNIFYHNDPSNPNDDLEFLKVRSEKGANSLTLNSYRIKTEANSSYKNHNLSVGAEYRVSEISNKINETFYEEGDSLLTEKPVNTNFSEKYNLNSFSFFVENYILLSDNIEANLGLRFLKYDYSYENLFSPRAYITYKLSPFNSFKFSWGYYYQPPFINELQSTRIKNLKAQRAIHYVIGWENQVNEKLKFKADIYYKDLNNLIPFYFDEFRMVYVDQNNREGYAFGMDLMYEGEIVEGMKSWVGYSYLNTKERKIGEQLKYQRRLLDQNHTIQIFLQDKMKKHPNWQSHLRFLLGSGYLYYPRKLITNEEISETFVDIDFTNPQEYFFYFRVDMGLSASFELGKNYKLTAIAEILNIFNRYNAGAYEWIHIFKEIEAPFKIPHILSKRFLNLKVEFSF